MNNKIEVFDLKEDKKIKAKCLLIDIDIRKYIELIKDNLESLDIQRGKIISRKRDVYKRLIKDLTEGTIMPPISLTLSEKSDLQNKIKDIFELREIEKLINKEIKDGDLFILDGLQRTYCILNAIDDLKESNKKETFLNTRIRAELWYNITYTALLYKMLVLNTGQVKMSMKHQIEILNIPLKEKISGIALQKEISVKFSTYRDSQPTKDIYNYRFSNIVEAFTSFITRNPIVDKTNEVVKELERMKFVEEHAQLEILSKEDEVQEFTELLITLDDALWHKYKQPIKDEDEGGIGTEMPWTSRNEILNSSAVLSGIFASFGEAFKLRKEKYNERKRKFFQVLKTDEEDPLELEIMSKILQDEKKRSTKFGETTRNFFYNALREFFRGEDDFKEIWQRAS